VLPYDPTTVPRVKTMVPALDEAIGGLAEGALTVFTGLPGAGKSTLTGQ
jgi:KaiC/GvpD/RAD55 family RecA-like ATPase